MEISREELNRLIDSRIEERKRNRHTVTKILDEFYPLKLRYGLRTAMCTFLKEHFEVKNINAIPKEKADEVRELAKKILKLI